MERDENTSFGVFTPVGDAVISFPSADQANAARTALGRLGIAGDAILRLTDREMLTHIDGDIQAEEPSRTLVKCSATTTISAVLTVTLA